MIFFKFIKWQWSRVTYANKQSMILALVTVVSSAVAMYLFGNLVAMLLAGVGGFAVSVILMMGYEWGVVNWSAFKRHQEREAQEITDKLRGRR